MMLQCFSSRAYCFSFKNFEGCLAAHLNLMSSGAVAGAGHIEECHREPFNFSRPFLAGSGTLLFWQ